MIVLNRKAIVSFRSNEFPVFLGKGFHVEGDFENYPGFGS